MIDAMGCQTEIAAKIVDGVADDCLAVKGNQPKLHEDIKALFFDQLEDDVARIAVTEHHRQETDRGRIDEGIYYLCEIPDELRDASRWKNLRAIGMSINNTQRRKADEIAVRSNVIGQVLEGESSAGAAWDHRAIENRCHWQLDVTFGEAPCRSHKGHGDEDFSTALSLLKHAKTAQ